MQKICTTTRACLFPDTLYSLIPHNESQLERLFYFASVFHVHWLSASFVAAGAQLSSTDLPPAIKSILKAPKSPLKQRKTCTCKCLSSFPLHPSLQVPIICSSQVSLQVIATILLPGLTVKADTLSLNHLKLSVIMTDTPTHSLNILHPQESHCCLGYTVIASDQVQTRSGQRVWGRKLDQMCHHQVGTLLQLMSISQIQSNNRNEI